MNSIAFVALDLCQSKLEVKSILGHLYVIELKPQYFLSLGENTQFNFEGFARYSDKDTDSNYTDIREMMLYYYIQKRYLKGQYVKASYCRFD